MTTDDLKARTKSFAIQPEANELVPIFVATSKTEKNSLHKGSSKN